MKKIYILTILAVAAMFVASCDLTENNPNETSPATVFKTKDNVEAALAPFNKLLPKISSTYSKDFGEADYLTSNSLSVDIDPGSLTDWDQDDWATLRNINYFIASVSGASCPLSKGEKDDFIGRAKFFRAYWYYKKLVSYGDMRILDHVLVAGNEADVYAGRDSRDNVVEFIFNDLKAAYETITHVSPDHTTPDKWCAKFLEMRVALYEASFRKYNNVTTSVDGKEFTIFSVEDLYKKAMICAEEIMNNSGYKLHGNYRELFTSADKKAINDETLLQVAAGASISGSQNYYFNAVGANKNICREFINTYLMKDGSFYSSKAGYQTESFATEFTNRDPRLAMTVRTPGYKFGASEKDVPVAVAPNLVGLATYLGYQPIKFIYDYALDGNGDKQSDLNDNGEPLFRYAEVLLTYAEACAELGNATSEWWPKTIGELRKRAGFDATAANKVPTSADPVLAKLYPNVADNVACLEVRREKAVEFCMEGQRRNDIIRWGCGKLLKDMPWDGINIAALEQPINVDGLAETGINGYDCYFTADVTTVPTEYATIAVLVNQQDAYLQTVKNSDNTYRLTYSVPVNTRFWADKLILKPIPQATIEKYAAHGYGDGMKQNPGY